jgi:hypothetical protein
VVEWLNLRRQDSWLVSEVSQAPLVDGSDCGGCRRPGPSRSAAVVARDEIDHAFLACRLSGSGDLATAFEDEQIMHKLRLADGNRGC